MQQDAGTSSAATAASSSFLADRAELKALTMDARLATAEFKREQDVLKRAREEFRREQDAYQQAQQQILHSIQLLHIL